MKKNIVQKISKWGECPQTFQSLWNNINPALKEQLTSKQLALLINDLQRLYNEGKNSAGAEVIDACPDSGAVWVDCLNRTIEWEKQGGNLEIKLENS